MGLHEYILSFPRGERSEVRRKIAKAAGVTESCIKHYANGLRNCPPVRAKNIEQVTGGKVSAVELVFHHAA